MTVNKMLTHRWAEYRYSHANDNNKVVRKAWIRDSQTILEVGDGYLALSPKGEEKGRFSDLEEAKNSFEGSAGLTPVSVDLQGTEANIDDFLDCIDEMSDLPNN